MNSPILRGTDQWRECSQQADAARRRHFGSGTRRKGFARKRAARHNKGSLQARPSGRSQHGAAGPGGPYCIRMSRPSAACIMKYHDVEQQLRDERARTRGTEAVRAMKPAAPASSGARFDAALGVASSSADAWSLRGQRSSERRAVLAVLAATEAERGLWQAHHVVQARPGRHTPREARGSEIMPQVSFGGKR